MKGNYCCTLEHDVQHNRKLSSKPGNHSEEIGQMFKNALN